jgi:hypothetical protein
VTPASGAVRSPFLKGDVVSRVFRVECKLTEKGSYILKRDVLDKIEQEALFNKQSPLMSLSISGEKYAVLRWSDFEQMAHDAGYL